MSAPTAEITYEDEEISQPIISELTDTIPPANDFEYSCEVCGKELHYGGRGRKPKRCDEHKVNKRANNGPTVQRSTRWQQPLADALNAQFMTIGMVAFAFNQFDGKCIMNGAPNLSIALIGVAETNPTVRAGLENFVKAGAWAQVATAVAAIAIPIMSNHGMIPEGLKLPTPKVA